MTSWLKKKFCVSFWWLFLSKTETMSSVRLMRASSLLQQQARSSAGLTAPFPSTTKKLCPLLAASPISPLSSVSSPLSFTTPSSRSSFFFRAYTTTNEDESDGLQSSGDDFFSESDDPFNTSDDDWLKEQDSDVEEGEFELGGRKIPAQRKPYSTLETNYLIRQLKKQAERDDLIPEENKIKNIVKEFADYKNNEELNQYIDTLDQSIADATKKTAQDQIKELEQLRDFKIKENARLAALPKPFDWVPDVNDTGPVYDPARSGNGIFPPIMGPVEEVADFYLRLYPSLYPFRDVIVYKFMQKTLEVSDWYDHTIPQYSDILKRAKDLGLFEHFAGLDDEKSIVQEIAASQGLSLEEWGNAEFQIKALKHQRAACFWDPPFDAMIPTMQDLEDIVAALERDYPGERPIQNLENAILNSDDASDACARFVLNCQQLNEDTKSLNVLPRQYAVQMENMLYPGMFEGHLAYNDWRHNPWVQQMADRITEKERKMEMESVDRLMGRLPSFVHNLNEKMEALELPKGSVVDGVVDPEKATEAIERLINSLSQTELVELEYMLSKPKDSKERRCLNYFSTFFTARPYLHDGQHLYSDNALIHLMNRQKTIQRIHAREKKEGSPFTNFENTVGVEGFEFPSAAAIEAGKRTELIGEDDVKVYNSAESAFTLSLTRDEAQHLTQFGISLDEAKDKVIDEAMIEVEEEMIRDSSNIEDGFEWDRMLTEQRLAQAQKTEKQYERHLDKSWRHRFPNTLLNHYRDHVERDDEMIDRKNLKPKERNCMYSVMKNPPKLEPWNVPLLRMLVDEVGNIRSRRETGFSPKYQRKIAPVLRRAVQLGFFSYKKGDFTVIDPFRPMPWKPVQHGLYPEDVIEALEDFEEEEAEQFMDLYKAETKDDDPVKDMEEIEKEAAQMRYVPGNHAMKKRKQTFPQWGK